jgi:sugar/nucleoside kinase (ribokinase family)
MPIQVQGTLVEALDGPFLSLDPFVLLRPDSLEAFRGLAARVDALFLSEDEMELPDAAALRDLAQGRLATILYKRGARGGTVLIREQLRALTWAPRAAEVVDPTGAGDAFAAGVLAGWLRGEPHERALQRGIVGASFALEDWGPAGIFRATPEAAEARLREWFA